MKRKRFIIILLTILVLIAASGSFYELMLSQTYPAPGQFVVVGDHQLHLRKMGEGSPTIILEAGSAESSLIWRDLPEQLAKFAAVVSYDRAGYAWSEKAKTPRTGENIVSELYAALQKLDMEGPYILVAHSAGGLYSRLFAMKYPEVVAGLLLLDPTPENFSQESAMIYAKEGIDPNDTGLPSDTMLRVMKHTGILRLLKDSLLSQLPEEERSRFIDVELNGSYVDTIEQENSLLGLTEKELQGQKIGSIPLRIITHGVPNDATLLGMSVESSNRLEDIWQKLQQETLQISSDSKLIVAKNSGHMIMHDEPELVLETIRELWLAVQ